MSFVTLIYIYSTLSNKKFDLLLRLFGQSREF